MRPRKKDNNHNAISSELQSLGCWVTDTSAMGNGFPDMLVHIKFADSCPLPVYEIHSTEEARDLIIHSKYEPRW